MKSLLISIFVVYWVGFNFTYIMLIARYMKKHGIENIKEADQKHMDWAEKLFMICLKGWWRYWV